MRERLNTTPTWALLLIMWFFWSAFAFVMGVISDGTMLWNVVFAVLIGLIVAPGITFGIKRRLRWENSAVGDVPADVRQTAIRAAWKGPVPADPEIRAAAIGVAEEHLRQLRRGRPLLLIAMTFTLVAAVGNAFIGSLWSLFYVVPVTGLLASFFLAPGRLRKRLALLSEQQ